VRVTCLLLRPVYQELIRQEKLTGVENGKPGYSWRRRLAFRQPKGSFSN
jgi:hypothetical protein